jgi:protein gp37
VRFLSIEPLLGDLGQIDLHNIHWVIVGGESGHGARPMNSAWVRAILTQCRAAKVPFFFKQWGGRQKSKAGRLLDQRTFYELPPIIRAPIPSRGEHLSFAARFEREIEVWTDTTELVKIA